HSPAKAQPMPAMMNDIARAGPAKSLAARPVMTKIPAPITDPTPRAVSDHFPRTRLSPLWAISDSYIATVLRAFHCCFIVVRFKDSFDGPVWGLAMIRFFPF